MGADHNQGADGDHLSRSITNKRQMYALLEAGAFGNTVPMWLDATSWYCDTASTRYAWWGVRTLTPGGPCRLFCPAAEVMATCADFRRQGHQPQISMMVDRVSTVLLWADVYDTPTGLEVYGIEHPPQGGSWRALMPSQGQTWKGLAARSLLARTLNPSSLADLWATLERWPGHVVELSALDRCLGTVPGRNAVVWEVRNY